MANNGFVKIHRKLLDNPIVCKDSDYFSVWCYLLLTATHAGYDKEFKGKRITLQPGQLITGRKAIAKKFKIDESKVQRILKKFENEHQIEQQSSNRNRLITILNWDGYQKSEQQNERQVNNKRTTDAQQVNNRCTTDEHIQECKECKNGEEEKNDKNDSSSKQSSDKPLKFANDPESMPFRLTAYLIKHMKRNDPKCKAPNEGTKQFDDWCVHMDRLMRLDGRSSEEVKKVIEWTQNDSFEQTVVLSASKLRDRFPQLLLKATKPTSASKKNDFHNFKGAASKYSPDELEAKYLAKHGRKK